MVELMLKLFMIIVPDKKQKSRVWLLFRAIIADRRIQRRSNYVLVLLSVILLMEHVFIPLGILWILKGALIPLINKFFSNG